MADRTFEKIGDGGKPDMGMRGNVNPLPRLERCRSHAIKKHERTDRADIPMWQDAAHGQGTKIGFLARDQYRHAPPPF